MSEITASYYTTERESALNIQHWASRNGYLQYSSRGEPYDVNDPGRTRDIRAEPQESQAKRLSNLLHAAEEKKKKNSSYLIIQEQIDNDPNIIQAEERYRTVYRMPDGSILGYPARDKWSDNHIRPFVLEYPQGCRSKLAEESNQQSPAVKTLPPEKEELQEVRG